MKRTTAAAAIALLAGAAVLPVGASAQGSDPWTFGLTLYGYFPTIDGTSRFPLNGQGSDISVDSDTILDSLQGVFMGAFEARRGRWGAFTDFIYIDLGNDRSGTRDLTIGGNPLPIGASANVRYDLTGYAWTVAGTYRLIGDPGLTVDALAGARRLDVEQTLGWEVSGNVGSIPTPGRGGTLETSSANWDGVIGVKGRLSFGPERRWFVPYYADVGTGESDLTWQAMAGVGYSFGWGDIFAAWRYLEYNLKSDSSFEDLSFNGPAIAVTFRW